MARSKIVSVAALVLVLAGVMICSAEESAKSLTVVFKDGHEKSVTIPDGSRIEFKSGSMTLSHGRNVETIRMADVARIDFSSSNSMPLGRNHFVGKWEFGTGVGSGTFFVTLDRDGHAHKSLGSTNGTWTVVDGEARITWDDGWRDIIRKVGDKHQKFAYEPGRSLSEDPSNVTDAKTRNAEPI
jgi:hypothetical protein